MTRNWRPKFIVGSVIALLACKWFVFPQFFGPTVHNVATFIPRDEKAPGNVYFGDAKAPTYVTAWLAPDCSYCRIWWRNNAQTLGAANVMQGQVEYIIRPLPETTRDVYVAQFLYCLPDNQTRKLALQDFMVESDWMTKPMLDWPDATMVSKSCMSNSTYRHTILTNAKQDVQLYGLSGTPSFGIRNKIILGQTNIALGGK